jgi:asparagine synthase (glutamine-hydrolysing)
LFRPEPLHDPLAALDVDLYRQVGAQCRVAMTGDGGDILLYPQSGPYIAHLLRRRQFGRLMSEVGSYVFSHRRIPPPLVGIRSKIARWLGKASLDPPFPTWLNPDFAARLHLRNRFEELNRAPAGIHPFRPDAYRTLQAPFWPCEFESADAAVTLSPIEIRFPFFDLRVVRLLLALPPIPWCVDKELLRMAMRGILPEEIRLRPKTPLPGNPALDLLERPGPDSLSHPESVPALAQYVVRDAFPGVRGDAGSEELWVNLRPVSLNYWMLQNSLFLKYKCAREENREVTRSQAY